MREPRPIQGLKAPLFERLQDDGTGVPGLRVQQPSSPNRALDLVRLRDSVRDDLSRLLNTRTSLRGTLQELAHGTVLDYGIPNLAPIAPASDSQRSQLATLLEKIISIYEPRLQFAKILIQQDKRDPRALLGVISGHLVSGNLMEPVYFPLALDRSAKKVEVGTNELAED